MSKKQKPTSYLSESSAVEARTVKAPILLLMVAGLHGLAVGAFLMISGCGTRQPVVEPPPAPIMPPSAGTATAPSPAVPRPDFRPPVAVEPAPATIQGTVGDTYTIKKGDSLSKIAARHGVTVRELAEINQLKDADVIRVGQKLVLPAHAKDLPDEAPAAKKPAARSAAPAASGGNYEVKAGDSLSRIAAANGTTVRAIKDANGLTSDLIRIGQKLVIPGSSAAPAPAAASRTAPVVETAQAPEPEPETAAPAPAPAMADPVSMDVEEPAAVETPSLSDASSSGNAPFPYTVREGDDLEKIARSFGVLQGDIMSLNGLNNASEIKPGMKLKIPWYTPE